MSDSAGTMKPRPIRTSACALQTRERTHTHSNQTREHTLSLSHTHTQVTAKQHNGEDDEEGNLIPDDHVQKAHDFRLYKVRAQQHDAWKSFVSLSRARAL